MHISGCTSQSTEEKLKLFPNMREKSNKIRQCNAI